MKQRQLARTAYVFVAAENTLESIGEDVGGAVPRCKKAPNQAKSGPETAEIALRSFSLFQASSTAGARAALERFEGRWVAVDLASPRLAAAADLDKLYSGANAVLATAEEAQAVTGSGPEEAVTELAARFGLACVKLGDQGALAAEGKRVIRARADPVARRSRFGAGDAFAAALLVSLGNGQAIDRALDAACAEGARAAASRDGWPDTMAAARKRFPSC